MLGLGLGITGIFGGGFDPASLFLAADQGLAIDPFDLSTLFQDSAGTTPVTAAGQSVGLIRDRSGRGNHAAQSVSLGRPTLGRHPKGGARNRLTYTEDFTHAAWVKAQGAATADAIAAPNGTLTADLFTENTTDTQHDIRQALAFTSGVAYTLSFYLKANGRNAQIVFPIGTAGFGAIFDLTTGAVTAVGGTVTASAVDVGNGWWRCRVTDTATSTASQTIRVTTHNGTTNSYAGDGASGFYIWGAQLEIGAAMTPYQRAVSAFDVTEAGVSDVWYLGLDGLDDWLAIGSFTMRGDRTMIVALHKPSDAVKGTVIEHRPNFTTTGGLRGVAPETDGTATYGFNSNTTAGNTLQVVTGVPAPRTDVLTYTIKSDQRTTRLNGSVHVTNDPNGDTAPTTAGMTIGSRDGTSLFFTGRIYGLLLIDLVLTAPEITLVERHFADRIGVTLA